MSGLLEVLGTWLPQQRWYAGKGREVESVVAEQISTLAEVDGVRVLDLVLAVTHPGTHSGGDTVRYQVPVTVRREPAETLVAALVDETDDGFVYDGLADPVGNATWLRLLVASAQTDGVAFARRAEVDGEAPGRVVGVEQSNTSVIYGETSILKVFRRLAPGLNPDLEVTRALAEAGSTHVPEPLGWVDGDVAGERTTLAFLQSYVRNAADGWKLATASLRDLFDEADLRADEVGGDFAGESERLGRATADVHATLADVMPSGTASLEEAAATSAQMHERLDRAVTEVAALAPFADGLRSAYDEVAVVDGVDVQRVHGDFHLGQVLRTGTGWTLLDFEGEPARPLAERTALMSPLRDVAGMLRSFDYAARSQLMERRGDAQLAYRATEWAERNRAAFCDGYAEASGRDPRGESVLLRAFELDKAVYEVVYEARHRPSWLAIPLGSVERLAAEGR